MYLQGLVYLEYFAIHSYRPICCIFTHEDYNITFRYMFSLSFWFNLGGLGAPGEDRGIIEGSKAHAHAKAMTGSWDFFCSIYLLCCVCFFGGDSASRAGAVSHTIAWGFGLNSIRLLPSKAGSAFISTNGRFGGTKDAKKWARPAFVLWKGGGGRAGRGGTMQGWWWAGGREMGRERFMLGRVFRSRKVDIFI